MSKKSRKKANQNRTKKSSSPAEEFYRQDENDPKTYAGRKRERVRLGGIGDDGLLMTKPRFNAHRILNLYFIWGLIMVGIGAIAAVLPLFLGETLAPGTLLASGGLIFNDISLSLLLRLEGFYCLITGTVAFGASFLGFSWLYDGATPSTSRLWSYVGTYSSAIWFVAALFLLHIPEPLSLLSFILFVSFLRTSKKVEREKETPGELVA